MTDDVETVRDVIFDDCAVVDECSLAFGAVVVDVVVESLPDEIQAMEMVQAFNVRWVATSIFGVDLYLIGLDARFWRFVNRHCNASVYISVKILCLF